MVQYMVSILYDDDNDNDKDDDGGGDCNDNCDDDGANDLRAKYSGSTVEALPTFHHR